MNTLPWCLRCLLGLATSECAALVACGGVRGWPQGTLRIPLDWTRVQGLPGPNVCMPDP